MADGVARVVVEADTSLAQAAFTKLRADAERTMDAIGRQHAQAEVDAKTTEFDRKIDNVKRKLAQLEGETASAEVDVDGAAESTAEIEALRKELKALNRDRATIRVDSKELRDANKQRDISAKKQAAMAKAYLDEERALGKMAAARAKAAAAEERDLRQRGQLMTRAIRDNEGFDDSIIKNNATLAKARVAYAKTRGEVERLETKTGRPGGIFRTAGETRGLEAARAEAARLEHEITKLGGTVNDIDPDLERHQGILSRWGHSISSVRIQMGFFSATVRQMALGVVALGPVLTGLLGSLVSVVGVLGTGLAGAASVGAAGFAGFALSALGVGLVIAPMAKQFGEAKKASEALSKAQMKYGKDSTQAKTAQEQFNHVLKGVSPEARQAFKDYGQLGSQWAKLTSAAKPAVFDAFGSSLKTAQALLPEFAKESVATTKVAGKAWEGWMKSLRSPEAKQLLGEVMSNFRSSIPGIADGLGSLSAAFGRIMASASKMLPSLSDGFADWANGIEDAVGKGPKLDASIRGIVSQMQDLGHLSQDTGSFLVHLFSASADSGDDLVKSLDGVIKKWDAWTQSTEGQSSLKSFFSEAADETKQLFAALAPLTRLLFAMGRAFAPVTAGAMSALRVIGDITSAAASFEPLRAVLAAVGASLATMWAVNKVQGFVTGLQGAAAALYKLAAGEEAVAAAQAEGGLSSLFLGKGKTSAAAIEREAAAVGTVGAESAAAAEGAGLLATALAPEVLIPAGLVAGLVLISTHLGDVDNTFEQAAKTAHRAGVELSHSTEQFVKDGSAYNSTVHRQVGVNKEATQARERVIAAQKKYGAASKQAMTATNELLQVEQKQVAQGVLAGRQRTQSVQDAKATLTAARARVQAAKEELVAAKAVTTDAQGTKFNANNKVVPGDPAQEAKNIAAAEQHRAAAMREVSVAAREMALANIPLERQTKGLAPISEHTEAALKKLSTTIGATATKRIGNFVKPQDVQQVANLSNRLTKLGQGSTVKKIDVKSRGADETLGKLRQLNKQTQRVSGSTAKLTVKSNDQQANQSLRKLAEQSQRLSGSRPTLRILGDSSNAEQAIHRLEAHITSVAHKKYQAEISAIDKTHGPLSAADSKLMATARRKYQATISARDNASHIAAGAEGKGKSFAKTYMAHLAVTGASQAVGEIASVQSALSSLHDKTVTVNVVRHGSPGGNFAGGPSAYLPFATGGMSDRMLQRAAEKAVTVKAGPSRKVDKPTMLTGEQGPSHPEYVIATNPAYRSSNERYLEDAAGSLGKEVVPAYAKGKGASKKSGGKKGASAAPSTSSILQQKPPEIPKKLHHYKPATKLNHGGALQMFNRLEKEIENEEGHYSSEMDHEEKEIAAGRMSQWHFGIFKNMREKILKDEREVKSKAIPGMEKSVTGQKTKAESAVEAAKRRLGQIGAHLKKSQETTKTLEHQYSKMERNKSENQQDFNKKKRAKKAEVDAAKARSDEWEKYQDELRKRRKAAEQVVQEAESELHKIRSEDKPANEDAIQGGEDELRYVKDVEEGTVEAPYAQQQEEEKEKPIERAEAEVLEAELLGPTGTAQLKGAREHLLAVAEGELAKARTTPAAADDIEALNEVKSAKEALEGGGPAGGSGPTPGEETATMNEARQSLYEQFASNITGNAGGFNLAAAALQSSSGASSAVAAATVGGGFGTSALGGGSTAGAGSGTVQVVNNFAAPPPDPHTWTKQQEFELGALS